MFWVSVVWHLVHITKFDYNVENRYLVLAQCTYVVLDEVSSSVSQHF